MKISPIVPGLLLGLVSAQVWSPAQARDIDKARIEQTVARLNMTDAQKKAARPIIEDSVRERVKFLQAAGFEQGKKPTFRQLRKVRGPIKQSRARTEARLSKVLNSTQMAEYRRITEENRKKLRARFGG